MRITFGRIDVDSGPVEGFFRQPVLIAADGPGRVEQEQDDERHSEDELEAAGAQFEVVDDVTADGHGQTVADGRNVQNAFGHHESDVEEQVGGRNERQH